MNTPDPRAEARNRANRRLRRMTIGTTVLGVASVGILGATAAFTYDGTTSTGNAVALVETADAGTSTTTTTTTTATPSTTPTVTSSSGSAHASTGGS